MTLNWFRSGGPRAPIDSTTGFISLPHVHCGTIDVAPGIGKLCQKADSLIMRLVIIQKLPKASNMLLPLQEGKAWYKETTSGLNISLSLLEHKFVFVRLPFILSTMFYKD